MPIAWRIVKTSHASGALSGEGARLYGARWTSRGRPAVYASESIALATLEILVHTASPALLAAYSLFRIEIPDTLITTLDEEALPDNWRDYPAPAALRRIGDDWLDRAPTPVLRVPSVIIPEEYNYVIDPGHVAFGRLTVRLVREHVLDGRLGRTP